jgi:hypothetical protein
MDKFLKFSIEKGILPVKSLLDKSSSLRDCSDPISEGIKPDSLLPYRQRTDKCFRVPIEEGILPVKSLLDKSRSLRDCSDPISGGIKPESLLPHR